MILENVNLQTRGVYKCDVIADASNFPSVQAEALMEVVGENLVYHDTFNICEGFKLIFV